eukprot:3012268-Pyramimonas_sp.AAC.1
MGAAALASRWSASAMRGLAAPACAPKTTDQSRLFVPSKCSGLPIVRTSAAQRSAAGAAPPRCAGAAARASSAACSACADSRLAAMSSCCVACICACRSRRTCSAIAAAASQRGLGALLAP